MSKQRSHSLPTQLHCVLALDLASNPDGTVSLLQVFQVLTVPKLPFVHRGFVAYLAHSGGHGQFSFNFRLIDAGETREPLTHFSINVNVLDPLAGGVALFKIPNIKFEHAGRYRLEAWHEELPVLAVGFEVRVVDPPRPPSPPGGA